MKKILLFFAILNFVFSFEFGALDPQYWNGIVVSEAGKIYGFRFAIRRGNEKADGYDTFFIVHNPGPFAPDGSYAEVSFDTTLPFGLGRKTPIRKKTLKKGILTLRYGKFKNGILGWLEIPESVKIDVIFYSPWNMGENFVEKHGRFISEDGNFSFLPLDKIKRTKKRKNEIIAEISGRKFHFYTGFGNFKHNGLWVENYLKERYKEYKNRRPRFEGEWEGLISSISNNIFWMRLLQPDKGRIYLPAGRRWIFPAPDGKPDLWTMFEWDSFFNALEASVENCKLAKNEIEAVLNTQYKWGNIPNWRSARNGSPDRGQPPVGAFTVLKVYQKCGSKALLKKSYETLRKFHNYWSHNVGLHHKRDGNSNGLYEWGSDTELLGKKIPKWERNVPGRVRAGWESGQDDLPNFDNAPFNERTNTLEMDCIDLSSLYALDSWAMGKMALIIGKKEDARKFFEEYKGVSHKINSYLWNPKEKFYFDRFWNGKFSNSKASSNFYPILAGISSKRRANFLLAHLLNPHEFWGQFVVPTISRDNPSFKEQQYWRGTIWPPTNYLIYQGLKRYGFDAVAAEFARKGANLFLQSWKKYRLCRENYNSITGEGGGNRYQSWGPLFALTLLEDFIDYSPFNGLRVGNLAAKDKNRIKNLRLRGNKYDLIGLPEELILYRNGEKILEFHGKAVLRNIKFKKGKITFKAKVYSDDLKIKPGYRNFTAKINGAKVKVKKGWLNLGKASWVVEFFRRKQ